MVQQAGPRTSSKSTGMEDLHRNSDYNTNETEIVTEIETSIERSIEKEGKQSWLNQAWNIRPQDANLFERSKNLNSELFGEWFIYVYTYNIYIHIYL